VRSPRFRRDPFIRDVASDPGRATVPRITAPHMLPSAVATASAPATSRISWLNPTPQMITVYASPWSSPSPTQHSLPGGRYPLPGPDFHRLDRASFAWRTANPSSQWTFTAYSLQVSRRTHSRCGPHGPLTFRRPFLRVLQTIRRLLNRPECSRLEREFAGPVFHRGVKAHRTIGPKILNAHWYADLIGRLHRAVAAILRTLRTIPLVLTRTALNGTTRAE
jgi:hypothetical protein